MCQTNLIGEAIDTPPSQYTGQWALSWYDIPHCEGKSSGIATTGSGCVSVGWDPGMLVGNRGVTPLAIVFASASLPTVPVMLVRVSPPSAIVTI